MSNGKLKQNRRLRRKRGIRKRVFGTPECPRLTVYRSLQHIYAQIIDDVSGRTVVSASSIKSPGGNRSAGAEVGRQLAQKATAGGIRQVAMDRNGFRFHGRLKALADAAREGGLKF